MTIRRVARMHGAWFLLAAAVITTAAAGARAPQAKIGAPAPAFELTATDGRTYSLADTKGRIVIIEWVNPNCPYVKRQYKDGAMLEAHRRVRAVAPDAVWLAVDSSHDATAASLAAWKRTNRVPYPVLLDADGAVGRVYDARRTPHMFIIDAEGVLRYHGAVDNDHTGRKPRSEVTNFVVEAVRQIQARQTVTPDYVKPYGCSIKYRNDRGKAAGKPKER